MIDSLAELFESVTRHRMRALATSFGVFWGIFMLTLLIASGNGLRNGIETLFEGDSAYQIWMFGNRTLKPFEGLGAGRQIQFTEDDAIALARSVTEIEHVTPRRGLAPSVMISHGNNTASLPGVAVYPSYVFNEKLKILRGRWLNEFDQREARKVAVLGYAARNVLFGNADPVGQAIQIGGVDFTVIGEYTDAGGEEEVRRVYIPFSTLQSTFDASRKAEFVVALLKEGESVERARTRIMRVLSVRHRFDPSDDGAVITWFAVEAYRKMQGLMRGIDYAILAVGLGTLLSGMVGVSNILFVSVRERAREFGVRRALGASARNVLWMVIGEALGLSLLAGGLGLLAALGLIAAVQGGALNTDYFRNPQIDLTTALSALGVLVITALVAGFFPAREAARMHPIEALRRE
ncbi:MAG TPA: ABC transporter permease [Polyangiales bacterium]|nr:ABC transporter permease [Polyangiales bacterium]